MKIRGRWYVTKGSAPYGGVSRPTRNAAGMAETSERSRHYTRPARVKEHRNDANRLSVYGTCDELAGLINFKVARSKRVCPCCRQRVAAVVLSDSGRSRLRMLRRIREARKS